LSFTVKVAVSAVSVLGVKVTLMVHEADEARLLPQVLVCAKSPALAPVNPTLEMLSATNSLFCKVKFLVLLGMFTATLPKLAEAGVSVASATPVPLRYEVSVLYPAGASSFTVRVAHSVIPLGVNVTLMVQELFAAKLLPQVSFSVKSVLLSAMLEMFSAAD